MTKKSELPSKVTGKTTHKKAGSKSRRSEVANTNFTCRTDRLLEKRDGFTQGYWITQHKQSGGHVPYSLEDCQEPILTRGLTSATITDNTYRTKDMHGYPSVYTLEVQREIESGNKNGQKIIKTFIGETKGLIGRSFATFVHSKYLQLKGTTYSSFMKRYKRAYRKNTDVLYPVISRETLLMELGEIHKHLTKGSKLHMDERDGLKLFSKSGMPLLSLGATEGVIKILKHEFKEGSFGFLKLYKTSTIKCTKRSQPKTFIEFINSRDKYNLKKDALKNVVLYSALEIPPEEIQDNSEFGGEQEE